MRDSGPNKNSKSTSAIEHAALIATPSGLAWNGGAWGVQKLLWFVHPRYRGPVLVRGVQLDGANRVRFERGALPPAELRLPVGTRARPSFVRIRKPGCYAFQIDGLTFSRSIVFRAARS